MTQDDYSRRALTATVAGQRSEISGYVTAHPTQLDELLRTLLIEAETQYDGEHQRLRLG